MLYANSCAAVNLCHRLLEERWDGGSIVSVGGWRTEARQELDVMNGTAVE